MLCQEISTIVKLILSANGYTCFSAYKDVETNEAFFNTLCSNIRFMRSGSRFYHAIERASWSSPRSYVLLPGHKSSIKYIFKMLSNAEKIIIKSIKWCNVFSIRKSYSSLYLISFTNVSFMEEMQNTVTNCNFLLSKLSGENQFGRV